jgi:hypothetical protein
MTMPTNVFRAAQDLECKREAMEYAHERVKTAIKAVTDAKNKAVRANEALAEAERDLTRAKGSVIFAEQRMASAGADLLSALKEANLMPDPNRPTVGKEPEHDHAKS